MQSLLRLEVKEDDLSQQIVVGAIQFAKDYTSLREFERAGDDGEEEEEEDGRMRCHRAAGDASSRFLRQALTDSFSQTASATKNHCNTSSATSR
ncbi:unnamed protein product [Nippostrongylus brasiliensis]|uniref:Uncharacterized protein n=1 Tax=Nippostrongylus brasiliensis TaxID=27835 RepID=A0A0N4XCI5_NIPBR|nr:unnamed protein product [Nippostrongylus brasiliensis]